MTKLQLIYGALIRYKALIFMAEGMGRILSSGESAGLRPLRRGEDRGRTPLDVAPAHQADDARILAQGVPDGPELPDMAQVQGVVFADHGGDFHNFSSFPKKMHFSLV